MLTRFEKARVLGARALQISLGAPMEEAVSYDPLITAERELDNGHIPISVKRRESE